MATASPITAAAAQPAPTAEPRRGFSEAFMRRLRELPPGPPMTERQERAIAEANATPKEDMIDGYELHDELVALGAVADVVGLDPNLTVEETARAVDWKGKIFGAEEPCRRT